MSDAFDHVQLSAISSAANRVAEAVGAIKEKDRLAVSRAVFDIAAETDTFDADALVQLAMDQLTPTRGWRFG